jgi:hypothetical protein
MATGERYEIRIRGHLDDRWSAWFDGLAVVAEENGETTLSGLIRDQAALYGVLAKVRDLGLPLIAVNRMVGGPRSRGRRS